MNYKNDQFYLDMLSIKNNSLTVQNYISNSFDNFWKSFYSYLTYFHKQINQSRVFIKGPKGYLVICFESINKILENTTIENYNESMKPFMTNCFKSMLHPDNLEFIKQAALDFFIIIYPRLKQSDINYTEDFEQYFFDFSFADSNLKITSIDNETRIQITDQEPPKSFNTKIDTFLNNIFKTFIVKPNDEYIKTWWTFIQKYIYGIFYYSIFKNKPAIQGISKLTDATQDTEKVLISFLINITQNGFLKIILLVENSPSYIVDILHYLSNESRISKINSLDFIMEFLKVLISTQVNIIEILYEDNYHLLLELMNILLNCLNFEFSNDNKLIPDLTSIITIYFNKIFNLFNEDYKYELCTYISHFDQITNSSCLLHFLTLLLCLFVNNRVTDKKIWEIIINSEVSFDVNVILSCYAHFAGYFSAYVFHTLLDLDVQQLSKSYTAAGKLGEFLDLNDLMWSKEFTDAFTMEYQKMFIELRQQLIHSLVLITPGITSIKMIDLFPNEQRQIPQKEEILQLLRVMFSSFVWQDKKYEKEELIQFYCYLICASFITPLLKISNVVSPDISFGRNFIIDEFLPYLKNCIKQSGSNLLIKLHALTTLGNIICWKTSLSALDKNSLADWYITLHDLIINGGDNSSSDDDSKGDLKLKIKLSALTFACRSVTLGFEGSSILLKTIADNFDLLNQIDTDKVQSGSSSGLSSYLVEEGFELLTSSDTASLLISLSNICEISNIFSFNCYNSSDNDHTDNNNNQDQRSIKDELKLKFIQNIIGTIHPSLCATAITSLISEEAEANRCNETNLNKLLSILFQYFKESTPEKVYATTTITLILPELEKVKKGSVALILNEALEALEEKKRENEKDLLLFGRFAEFVVDLLIYSSFIINTEEHLKHFAKIAQSWEATNDDSDNNNNIITDDQKELKELKDQTKQRLQYSVLSLASHYLRFPPPTPSFSPTNESEAKNFSSESTNKLPAASFGSSKDCILRISDDEIASLLPVGQFTWNFRSVAPKPEKRAVSNDVSITESASNVSDHPTQIEFTNKFENFVDDLYSNHFTEIPTESETEEDNKNQEDKGTTKTEGENDKNFDHFEVRNRHLYVPSDFESSFCPSFESGQSESTNLVREKLPPHSVGPKAAAFMSSLDFFDSQLSPRLFPAAQVYKSVEVSEFRHVIHIGFITLKSTENDDHYRDFRSGLGLLDESKTSIICADSRHQLVFHLKNDNLDQSPNVFICWDAQKPNEEWINSFDKEKQSIRIEIKPIHSGLFKVSILVNKNHHESDFQCLSNVLVTKNNLPNFVISQIIVNVHVLDFQNNKIVRVQLKNGIDIRDKRMKDFASYLLLLNCENTLLTKANSNHFDDDNDDNNEN